MSDFRSKCIAAAASVVMTAAIFLSLGQMAESTGVPSWIRAAEAKVVTAAASSSGEIKLAARTDVTTPTRF